MRIFIKSLLILLSAIILTSIIMFVTYSSAFAETSKDAESSENISVKVKSQQGLFNDVVNDYKIGDTFTFAVKLRANEKIVNGSFETHFDNSGLKVTDCTYNSMLGDAVSNFSDDIQVKFSEVDFNFSVPSQTADYTTEDVILTYTFKVLDTAADPQTITLNTVHLTGEGPSVSEDIFYVKKSVLNSDYIDRFNLSLELSQNDEIFSSAQTTDITESTQVTEAPTATDATETATEVSETTESTAAVETDATDTTPTKSSTATDTSTPAPTKATESIAPTTVQPTTTLSKTLSLEKSSVSAKAGSTYKIAVKNAGGKKISYKSNNEKILKVSSKGKVTFLKKGNSTVTVKVGSTKLTFKGKVTSDPKLTYKDKTVKASKTYKVSKGKTITIKIKGKADALKNKYTSTKIAKIKGKTTASKFKIKGLKKGTTTLKITVNRSKTFKIKVKVN